MEQTLNRIQDNEQQVSQFSTMHLLETPPHGNNNLENPDGLTNPSSNIFLRILTGSVSQMLQRTEITMSSYMYEVTGIFTSIGLLHPYCPPGPGNEAVLYLRDYYNSAAVVQVIQPTQKFPQMLTGIHAGQSIRCLGKVLDEHTILAVKISIISPANALHYARCQFVSHKALPLFSI